MMRWVWLWMGLGVLGGGCHALPPWEEIPPEGYQLRKGVTVLDTAVVVKEDTSTVVVTSDVTLRSGDVILTPRAARRIDSVRYEGNRVVLYTQPASLEDVFAYANLRWSDSLRLPVELVRARLQSMPRVMQRTLDTLFMGRPVRVWVRIVLRPDRFPKEDTLRYTTEISIPMDIESAVRWSVGAGTGEGFVEIAFSGAGELRPRFAAEVSLRVGWTGLEYFYGAVGMGTTFTLNGTKTFKAGVGFEIPLDSLTRLLNNQINQLLSALTYTLGPVPVGTLGPVPLFFSLNLRPYGEMNIVAESRGGVTQTFVLSLVSETWVGAVYANGQVQPIAEASHDPPAVYFAPPHTFYEGEIGLEEVVGLRMEPRLSVAEMVGLSLSVGSGIQGEQTVEIRPSPPPPVVTLGVRVGPVVRASVVLDLVRILRFETEVWSGVFLPLWEHRVTYTGSCKGGVASWYGGGFCGL